MAEYRCFVGYDGGERKVFPVGLKPAWRWTRDESKTGGDYKLQWQGNVKFRDHGEADDFTYLLAIHDNDPCASVDFRLERRISATFATLFEGRLSMKDAKWSRSRRTAEFRPRAIDGFECAREGVKEEVNMLDFPKTSVAFISGGLERKRCPATGSKQSGNWILSSVPRNDDCIAPGVGWTHQSTLHSVNESTLSGGTYVHRSRYFSEWVRERIDESPNSPGVGWIDLGGQSWARPVITADTVQTVDGAGVLNSVRQTNEIYDRPIDNGVLLSEVFARMAPCPDFSFRSDFFHYQPDGTYPRNGPYAASRSFEDLVVYQKSDVKRPYVSNNANNAPLSWEELLKMLALFNVEARFVGDIYRLEHVSYFNPDTGLDFASEGADERRVAAIRYRDAWEYKSERMPPVERFIFTEPVGPYFEANPITYDRACSDAEGRDQEYTFGKLNPDVGFVIGGGDDIADAGFVIAGVSNTGGQWAFTREQAKNGLGPVVVNGHMTWYNLHERYWRHDRPQLGGTMNGAATTFESSQPNREQEEIEWQVKPSELLAFNPSELIRTQLGWGKVAEANYDSEREVLSLKLLFE